MTLFLSFRSDPRAGSVLATPQILEWDRSFAADAHRLLGSLPPLSGREVVLATHGFNVDRKDGIRSLFRLEQELALPTGSFLFVGVLWPGDWWIPVVNYPAEADDATRCGRHLATFVDQHLGQASSVSLVSHSLGARVVLEAVKQMRRKAREVCVLAAAADDDCLTSSQYRQARENASRTSVLASRGDRVLKLAYPAGDFFSDLFFRDDDSPRRKALGYHGPRPFPATSALHAQIPGTKYGHDDYLPPPDLDEAITDQVRRPIHWVREALLGLQHEWP